MKLSTTLLRRASGRFGLRLVLTALLLSPLAAWSDSSAEKLNKVVEPYTDAQREADKKKPLTYAPGTVSKKGAIPDSLDCSTFVSPVLHRYLGKEWNTFDATIQQGWGDQIAKSYGLGPGLIEKSLQEHLKSLDSGTLPAGVYFFDLRNEDSLKPTKPSGARGHVGFLIVSGSGASQKVTQIHMSGTKSATGKEGGGLAYNDSRWKAFLTQSAYGNSAAKQASSKVFLYPLP